MLIPSGASVAVADGETLNMFRNDGDEANPSLVKMPATDVNTGNKGSGGRHNSSSANPAGTQLTEDNFAAGIADQLNQKVLLGKISDLIVIAAPRTLGELRKSYHAKLSVILVGEIAKDLTGHSIQDIEKTIAAA